MREIIIQEWRDDLGILHQERVGEIVRCRDCIYYLGHTEYCECDHFAEDDGYCHDGKKENKEMIWEADDKSCKNIEIAGEKILEISDGWYIDKVFYPDKKSGNEMNSISLEIRRDSKRAW